MTMQITSLNSSTSTNASLNTATMGHKVTPVQELNDVLTPEQQNKAQQAIDDKLTEQVNNIKGNYQTAKDHDLMTSYYEQQQKLLDIYMQTNTKESTSISSTSSDNSSAVVSLTKAYSDLYQLHQGIKEGIGNLPNIDTDEGAVTLPSSNQLLSTSSTEVQSNNLSSALSNQQINTYNSLMMPSTSSYIHLSA